MIYALSDIHGNTPAFDRVLSAISLTAADRLYIIGDVVDRGPDGVTLLRRIRRMPRTTLMLGNHEHMMIDRLRHPDEYAYQRRWYRNGGEVTETCFLALPGQEQEDLLRYLEALPVQISLAVGGRDFTLVHACPVELYDAGRSKYRDAREFAVWEREMLTHSFPDGRTVVFGHTPTGYLQPTEGKMRVYREGQWIGIDCGCAYPDEGGRLACLRLDDLRVFYSDE